MIITTAVIASVAAIHFTAAWVIGLMVGALLIGGLAGAGILHLLKRSASQNQEHVKALAKLREENTVRNERLQKLEESIILKAANEGGAIATACLELVKLMHSSLSSLDEQIEVTSRANEKLTSLVSMLGQTMKSSSSEAMPLLEETKRLLEEAKTTIHDSALSGQNLANIARLLDESFANFKAKREGLETVVQENKTEITTLMRQLKKAANGAEIQQIVDSKNLEINALQTRNEELISLLSAFKLRFQPLLSELQKTKDTIKSLKKTEREQQAQKERLEGVVHKLEEKLLEINPQDEPPINPSQGGATLPNSSSYSPRMYGGSHS